MTTDAVLLAKIETLTKTVEQQGGALKAAHLTIDKLPDGHPNSPVYGHLKLPHLN